MINQKDNILMMLYVRACSLMRKSNHYKLLNMYKVRCAILDLHNGKDMSPDMRNILKNFARSISMQDAELAWLSHVGYMDPNLLSSFHQIIYDIHSN